MKQAIEGVKNNGKIIAYIFLIAVVLCTSILITKVSTSISVGADAPKVALGAGLEKYINYAISKEEKGTLVQYNIQTGIDYPEGQENTPVKQSEVIVNLNQIDGKYPYDVKVIAKEYTYDQSSGAVTIKANNQNEDGELINNVVPNKDDRDEYVIICYYDTYIQENAERELIANISSKYTLFTEDSIEISATGELKKNVTENIGDLTSIKYETEDIYNGHIKSNKINGTNYNTQYKEKEEIVISKKEAQEELEIVETNSFIKIEQNENGEQITEELGNNKELVYKSTKISKEDIIEILGEDGVIEILDESQQVIATIDKNTEFAEDGTYTINYENEPQEITIRTSQIKNEGILNIEHVKEIKNTMLETTAQVKTISKIYGIYEINNENIVEIKDAQTNVNVQLDNTNWNNKQQNEVTFNIQLDGNSAKNNMLQNPTLKIVLPSEVEKVILGNSSIVYANGLQLEEPYLETNGNGNINIVANLVGEQKEYSENELNLATDIKISATIILKKDIENTTGKVNLNYTNQYTLDETIETGNKNLQVQLGSYEEEKVPTVEENIVYNLAETTEQNNEGVETIDGLQMEVAPIRGDVNLENGDTVYEGEFIKYNIKVTNTTEQTMNNVTIVGNIAEGTTYGELQADYYNPRGEYTYQFDDTITSKTMEIGTLEPGKSKNVFYEVKIDDLAEGETRKEITSNIKAYSGQAEGANYNLRNLVKTADVQVFLSSYLDNTKDKWNYDLKLKAEEEKEVTLQLKVPEEYVLEYIGNNGEKISLDNVQINDNNVIITTLKTNQIYSFSGTIDSSKIIKETQDSKVELTAVATVVSNNIYKSNENRIIYSYETAEITMTSINEGEEVKYGDEIEYNITVKNTGRTNINDESYNTISIKIEDYLPEEVDPVSLTYEENGEVITEEIPNRITDENGNKMPEIELYFTIPYGESRTINVKTTAGSVYEKTKVENSATVSGISIDTKTSNIITHTILPYDYEEPEEPDDPVNPDDQIDPIDPVDPSEQDNYSIKGVAWIDEDEDGERQEDENVLSGITVMLINAQNGAVEKETTTNSNGAYGFYELKKENYIVAFKYDNGNYSLTEYQKSGVDSKVNSDVTNKSMTLQGQTMTVGATDIITLDSSKSNIDMGLVENKICDLKLDKYISKVSIRTKNGTKEQTYDNSKLAKVELKSKEIEGAVVVVEYKIVVTNEGEVATTAGTVVDYLPEGLTFSSELNTNWSEKRSGEIINTSIANKNIQPGESVELTLIATKTMSSDTTGTFTNKAEILETSNQSGIADRDSTPGNKQETEDDFSKADLIISISTGAIVYISAGIIISIIIGIAIFLACKHGVLKINKTSLFMAVLATFILLQYTTTLAATTWNVDNNVRFQYESNVLKYQYPYASQEMSIYGTMQWFSSWFYRDRKGANTGNAVCIDHGINAYTGNSSYTYMGYAETRRNSSTNKESMTLKKLNNDIGAKTQGSNNIYGPFRVQCSNSSATYSFTVQDNSGRQITGYSTCDANGNSMTARGTCTFYLKIPISKCQNGVSKIKINTSKTGKKTTTTQVYGKAKYKSPRTATQNVQTWEDRLIKTETRQENITLSASVEWTNINGALEIIKEDSDNSNIKLEGVKLRVQCKSTNYDKTFTTDANGKVHIDDLPKGTYTITELSNNNYGYTELVIANVTMQSGSMTTYQLKNKKQTGNIKLTKTDFDSKVPLEGMSFKLKNSKGQYVIAVDENGKQQKQVTGRIYLGKMKFTSDINQATEFITDVNGNIEIYDILVDTYTVQEVSVGNNYYGYEVDGEYILWQIDGGVQTKGTSAKLKVKRQTSNNTSKAILTSSNSNQIKVGNIKKYVKLSGYAWEDILWTSGKEEYVNELYNEIEKGDVNDKKLANIVVQIKNKDGDVIQETVTNEDGEYIFEGVLIDELDQYYINFIYNGMSYETVSSNEETLKLENSTKAIEGDWRNLFNEKFSVIAEGEAQGTSGTNYPLQYDVENNKSKIHLGDDLKYGYELETDSAPSKEKIEKYKRNPVNGVYNHYKINANTYFAYRGFLDAIKSKEDIRTQGVTEIENINLGLKKREQPDIALVKDIESATVSINGQNHIYKYADRFKNEEAEYEAEPQTKFGQERSTASYTRGLYSSDISYDGDNNGEGKLDVKVTYKIGIKNQSQNLKVVVNEVTDYFDNKYEFVQAGTQINEDGSIKEGSVIGSSTPETYNSYYQKVTFTPYLEVSDESAIYVQFRVKPEEITKLIIGEDSENPEYVKLDNIAEVSSYSVKDLNGNKYAGIDVDSQPGNLNVINDGGWETNSWENNNTWEDDTDKAPGLLIVLQEERNTTGIVFEDTTELDNQAIEETQGKIRQGSGAYEEGEHGIEGVEVTLKNAHNGETVQVYNEDTKTWENASDITNENGEYNIGGYLPGEYYIEYTWGGQKYVDTQTGEETFYTVQDYKGTVIDQTVFANKSTDNLWYKDNFKKQYIGIEWNEENNSEIRTSDAIDNYETRKAIDGETTTMTYGEKKKVEDSYNTQTQDEEKLINKMTSTTPTFKVNIEYVDSLTNSTDEFKNDNGTVEITDGHAQRNEGFINTVENVDFGIVRRPKQVLALHKQVESAKIILADGSVLINAQIDENGNIINDAKNVISVPKAQASEAKIKVEIDSEIVQSARVELSYRFKTTNISELDYLNEEFYFYGSGYGEKQEDIVTLSANKVIDYIDNNMVTNVERDNSEYWKTLTQEELNSYMGEKSLLSPGGENDKETQEAREMQLNEGIRVIETEKLAGDLKPGESSEPIILTGYRLLANNEGSVLENNAEIIQVEKSGGSTLSTTPGNYIPGLNVTSEQDNSTAPGIEIIPPTGLTTNVIAYTILAISSLGILVSGIILIKKFVI